MKSLRFDSDLLLKLRMDSHQKFPSVKEKKKKERQEVDLGFIEVTDVLNGESTAKMILDSGCSHHIAGEHFEKYITERTSGQERVVKTACGTLRRSSTYVVLEIPLKKTDLTLRNILYIPGFGGMYVSIGQLMKKNENIKIEMTGEDMVVSREANNVVLELFRGTFEAPSTLSTFRQKRQNHHRVNPLVVHSESNQRKNLWKTKSRESQRTNPSHQTKSNQRTQVKRTVVRRQEGSAPRSLKPTMRRHASQRWQWTCMYGHPASIPIRYFGEVSTLRCRQDEEESEREVTRQTERSWRHCVR